MRSILKFTSLCVATLLLAGCTASAPTLQPTPSSVSQSADESNPAQKTADITSIELTRHNSKEDCWVSVSGNVYDITSYIPVHPGGPQAIIPNCGKDATSMFTSRNGKGPHPDAAAKMLAQFLVGKLAQ